MKDSGFSRVAGRRLVGVLVTIWCGLVLPLLARSATGVERQVLHGHVPRVVTDLHLQPVGRLAETNHLDLAIGLPLRNREVLTTLLQQIYEPASPQYHQYLTPEQFTEMFGPTDQDYQALIDFVKANGLTVTGRHPNRVLLDVTGSLADIEKVFHVTMRVYQHPTEARTFYAPDVEPSLDLAVPVLNIAGLNNHAVPHPKQLIRKPSRKANNATPNVGSGPSGAYMGYDFRAAYLPGVTDLTGAGQVVGLFEFDGYYPNDITTYETQTGLPSVTLANVLVDGFNGIPTTGPNSGNSEVALDIEMAISMAPGLSKVIVYEAGPNGIANDILSRMASDNQAKQLSCSWGFGVDGPDATADQFFQEMATQGQSFFDASGDSDAFVGSTSASFPSDDPYITQVGGTTLTTAGPGSNWVSETVWNEGYVRHEGYLGSGGGISTSYPIPSWQQGISMSANQGSTTMRNVPDVAMVGDDIATVADNGQQETSVGTSFAAPLWAGFIALANQQAAAYGQPPVGFLNPAIYAIGKGANYTSDFHDITTGNNTTRSSPTQFFAVAGYDLCTGWGTPTGRNLIYALAGVKAMITSGPTVTNALLQVGNVVAVVAGETNVFAVSAVDPGGGALTYQWLFGDGTTNGWSTLGTALHAYTTNCGPYTASVTVSDGQATTSSNLNVAVACQLTITKLQVNLKFAKPNADSVSFSGTLDLGTNFNGTSKLVTLDIGGAQLAFTLNAKGRGANAFGSCKLAYNEKTKLWTLSATLAKGSWHTAWATSGLENTTVPKPGISVTLTVVVIIDTEAFAGERTMLYTATLNKSGSAK